MHWKWHTAKRCLMLINNDQIFTFFLSIHCFKNSCMHLFCVYSPRWVVRWSVSVCLWCDVIWFQSLTFKRHLLKLIKLCLCLSWCHLFLLCIFSLLINIVCFSFRFHVNNCFPLCSLDFSTVLFAAESHRRKWHGFFLNK